MITANGNGICRKKFSETKSDKSAAEPDFRGAAKIAPVNASALLAVAGLLGFLRLSQLAEACVLSALDRHGPMIVGDMCRLTGLRPAQMSRIIGRLTRPGRMLISTTFHPGDRRKVDLALTPAGQDALRERQAPLAKLLERLPEEEQAQLLRLLAKLCRLTSQVASATGQRATVNA